MRRALQCSIALLTVSGTIALAGGYDYPKEDLSGYELQPQLSVSDESDFSRSGHAVYAFGGYVYTHRFLSGQQNYLFGPPNPLSYTPSAIFPPDFNGVEIGVGKEWSRHVDFQLAYIQYFRERKYRTIDGVSFYVSQKMNGLLGDVAYIFNPDDQFQISAKAGAMLSEFHTNATANGSLYVPRDDSTKVDPAAGLEFLFQFNRNVGMRVSAMYVAETQTSLTHGQIDLMAGFSFSS